MVTIGSWTRRYASHQEWSTGESKRWNDHSEWYPSSSALLATWTRFSSVAHEPDTGAAKPIFTPATLPASGRAGSFVLRRCGYRRWGTARSWSTSIARALLVLAIAEPAVAG